MMLDRFNRKIDYLRISVTDRCNLSCTYCSRGRNNDFIKADRILSFEDITEFVRIAVKLGIVKIRLTGGEPLVRKDVASLVSMLSCIDGINDFSMTTNGVLLSRFAYDLKKAGRMRLNVSLDSTDEAKYREITGGGDLKMVLDGLKEARAAGFDNIKLNCVVDSSSRDEDAMKVRRFADENGYQVRFIRKMNFAEGRFWPVEGGSGGKCSLCSRLRLSCDGRLYPCLFSDICFSVRELGYENAIRQAIEYKPESGLKSGNKIHELGG